MTRALEPPPKKDPQKRTRAPLLPPGPRSRAGVRMSAAAARGEFLLQRCDACSSFIYPPRDACPHCLSEHTPFAPAPDGGELIAETTVRTSTDLYFRERTPWRVGTIRLDCGVVAIAHLHNEVRSPCRVRAALRLDKSGNGVLVALPLKDLPHMNDDPLMRELSASAKFRRVLITDGRAPIALPLAQALAANGASTIFVGIADVWRALPEEASFKAMGQVQIVPLDVTDTRSVDELAGDIGAKTDILINTADHVRPGGVTSRPGIVTSRDEFEVNVFGLQRLAQAFGPVMRARGADGVNSATAFVDILPIHAICNWPQFGAYSASAAARWSLNQCLRSEMRAGGVRVMSVLTGPIDDAWRQTIPPPKVEPDRLAKAIVDALERGVEETIVGDVGKDLWLRWRDDPKVLERELQS